jgi:Pentapeptide repeats (8 copies)
MANPDHWKTVLQGVVAWNDWREREPLIIPDLSGANLRNFSPWTFGGANFTGSDLSRANLSEANLSGAGLIGATLSGASLVDADITNADLTGCRIYGASAWGLKLNDETNQQNLIITTRDEPAITVDNIEVAQFIYLLLHNQKIRNVIDTITSKVVLILGRFTDERKAFLTLYGTNYASVTTCRSYSTSRSRPAEPRMRQ